MILVLGGTGEARGLAAALTGEGVAVTTSLAGRVMRPRLPAGEVRIGGFGGPEGLRRWLRAHRVAAVVDATHPFAERISASAAQACAEAGIPLLALCRPGWRQRPGDRWHRAADLHAAAGLVGELGHRVLLTTGRQGLGCFATFAEPWFLIRCVDPPSCPLPPHHELRLDRGPYTLAGETALFDEHRIDLLVTKDSGGKLTRAKLDVARSRSVPVIMVDRPPRPPVHTVHLVEEAASWALTQASGSSSPSSSRRSR